MLDADGRVVFAAGDIDTGVFPRSAVKALQALALVESGAADRLALSDAELALACASHGGEPVHVEVAAAMLGKAGREAACLECGAHWPMNEAAARALAAHGRMPGPLHNNCSGKHAGFICLAVDRGEDPAGYVQPCHPTMRAVTAPLAEMTETALHEGNRGIDGCGIPTYAIPLRALALAFARFATGRHLSPVRAAACARLRAAVAAHPYMVGGAGRFDTELMGELGLRVFAKGGAEGVHVVALPEAGLGIAIKCDDGAGRAANPLTAALTARFLGGSVPAHLLPQPLRNWTGTETGAVRLAGPVA